MGDVTQVNATHKLKYKEDITCVKDSLAHDSSPMKSLAKIWHANQYLAGGGVSGVVGLFIARNNYNKCDNASSSPIRKM